jgi:hypothetical protein
MDTNPKALRNGLSPEKTLKRWPNMPIKFQALEQRLQTVLALHQKLTHENKDKKAMDRAARLIRRLLKIYEAGMVA